MTEFHGYHGVPNCRNLSQCHKKLFKSVSVWKINLKFCAVASTKDAKYQKLDICRCDFNGSPVKRKHILSLKKLQN